MSSIKITSLQYIIVPIQKEINFEANLLPVSRISITPKVIEALENLKYIGEMRQRWNEIKRFQLSGALAIR